VSPELRAELRRSRDEVIRLLNAASAEAPLPAPVPGPFPLSHAQQRIWFLDQLAGAQAAYVIPAAVLLRGAVDIAGLRGAIGSVVARHDALRLRFFRSPDGAPVQEVAPHVSVDLSFDRCDELSAEDRRRAAERRIVARASEPFDLAVAPLFRTGLIRLATDEHVWYLCVHHLIADGASLRLLLHEVLDVYANGPSDPAESPAPTAPFSVFVAWQHDRLASPDGEAMVQRGCDRLRDAAPLELLTDWARAEEWRAAGAAEIFDVPASTVTRVSDTARAHGASLFGALLTAFHVLLARSAGQSDVTVGSVMANRTRSEFAPLVGCLANTVAIRAEVDPGASFTELLGQVQRATRAAWEDQELPLEVAVERLKTREPGRNPIFDVFFALNVPTPHMTRAGLHIEAFLVRPQAAKFDIAVFGEPSDDGLRLLVEYRTDVWGAESIRRLLARYICLLEACAAAPDTRVGELPLLPRRELAAIEATWAPASPRPDLETTVHGLVAEQCHRTPGAPAVKTSTGQLSYEELERRSERLGCALRARGLTRGRVVALLVERAIDLPVAMLGVLKAGAAYLPLDPGWPVERLRFMIEDSGARAVLSQDAATCPAAAPDGIPNLSMPALDGEPPAASASGIDASADDLAYIIYTSGSSGVPKGVEVTHRNVVNFLRSMRDVPGLRADDVMLAVTTIAFDIAVLEIVLPLTVGACTALVTRDVAADGAELVDALHATGATVMQATPATWRMVLGTGRSLPAGLRVLCGGERLPAELAADLCAAASDVWNLYGPTETTIWSTVSRVSAGQPPTLGHPIANTRVYVLDPCGAHAGFGVPGELVIAGAGVARGYLRRPDQTAARFAIDPFVGEGGARMYRTGDRAVLLPDGSVQFLGRMDAQLKIRGHRVEPAEIEAALGRHMDVHQAAVVGSAGEDGDARLVAFVVADPGAFDPSSFRRFLTDRLPGYMVPSVFAPVEALPLTANGKLDRAALEHRSRHLTPERPVAPRRPLRDGTEARLGAIWRDVLGVTHLSADDSFFDLGGHSLLAARVVARVEDALGVRVPIALFASRPTLEAHAAFVDASRQASDRRIERLLQWVESLSEEEAAKHLDAL
jgi:amino acid adenylation domain-containing protein